MSDWLIDHKLIVYCLLAFAVIACHAVWWRSRKRQFLMAAGTIIALLIALLILDHFVESDREQMVRKVGEVAEAVSMNDVDRAFLNVSSSFDRGGMNKDQFYRFCKGVRDTGKVTEVKVWDRQVIEVSRDAKSGTVAFGFKVVGSWGATPGTHIAKVIFTLDPDGQWRVKSFDVYEINQSKTPIAIPGMSGR